MLNSISRSLIHHATQVLTEATNFQYWNEFEKYIYKRRKYVIDPRGTDSFGSPLDSNTRLVRDKDGNRVFRISRMIKNDTFVMDEIVTRDEQGNTIRGLGILDVVYTFEKDFLLRNNFTKIEVDPLSRAVQKKLNQYYGEYEWERKNDLTIIHLT